MQVLMMTMPMSVIPDGRRVRVVNTVDATVGRRPVGAVMDVMVMNVVVDIVMHDRRTRIRWTRGHGDCDMGEAITRHRAVGSDLS